MNRHQKFSIPIVDYLRSMLPYLEPLHILSKPPIFSAFDFGSCICPSQNVAECSLSLLAIRIT